MMFGQRVVRICILLLVIISTQAFSESLQKKQKILFVYDTPDEKSAFFVNTFRAMLKELPFTVDEAPVERPVKNEVASYDAIVIYSRIMAFDMKSPVRAWVVRQKTFNKQKVSLFVTANRWFFESHYKKMLEMIQKRDANVVDAVTMATKDMSDEEKIKKVWEHLEKIGD